MGAITDIERDLQLAQRHTRNGAIAALVQSAFSAVIVPLLILTGAAEALPMDFGWWMLIGVPIYLVFGFGVWRHSRFCAIALFLIQLSDMLLRALETGMPFGLLTGLIFLYFYGRAIFGAFDVHAIHKRMHPERKTAPAWIIALIAVPAGLVGILIAALVGFGMASELQLIPPTAVLAGDDLSQRYHDQLREAGIVKDDEEIAYFYSEALLDVTSAGNVLTDRRVISYEIWNGQFDLYSAAFDEITYLGADPGDFFNDTILYVGTADENDFMLFLSAESGGDKDFLNALASRAGVAIDHEYRFDAPVEWTTEELQQLEDEIEVTFPIDSDSKTAGI